MSANAFNLDKSTILSAGKELSQVLTFNPLPDDRILTLCKLKAFADDNFDAAQMLQFFFCRVGNIVGKGVDVVTGVNKTSDCLVKG